MVRGYLPKHLKLSYPFLPRFIISDSLRTELCLLHPPYIIAIAALYMTCVLHGSISSKLHPPSGTTPGTAAGTTQTNAAPPSVGGPSRFQSPALSKDQEDRSPISAVAPPPAAPVSPRDEIINFLAGLNVSLELIGSVCQQVLAMYALWDSFTDQSEQDLSRRAERRETHRQFYSYRGMSPPPEKELITEKDVVAIVLRIRTDRESDLAQPLSARLLAVNRRMERIR
jgi:cyclin-C